MWRKNSEIFSLRNVVGFFCAVLCCVSLRTESGWVVVVWVISYQFAIRESSLKVPWPAVVLSSLCLFRPHYSLTTHSVCMQSIFIFSTEAQAFLERKME